MGPSFTDDNTSGRNVHTTTDLGQRVAEVLSFELTHGMTEVGVPHFTHATINSVCDGVDAVAHKILLVVKYIVVAA